jgi:hypothetical protein
MNTDRVSWLNLHKYIPWRQVRAIIYRKLNKYDYMLCKKAHFPKYKPQLTLGFSQYCARHDYINLINWSKRINLRWNSDCDEIAAFNGSTQVVQWILKKSRPNLERLARHAARGGHIHLLYLIKPLNHTEVVLGAIEGNQLRTLKWVDKSYYTQLIIFHVIRQSYMPIVEYLAPHLPWNLAWNTLLIEGSLELLHWANRKGVFATVNREEALHLVLSTQEAERVQFVLQDLQAHWTEETRERCLGIPELVHLLE